MWHVSSRSGVTTLRTAIHLLLTYLHAIETSHSVGTTGRILRIPYPTHKACLCHKQDGKLLRVL